MPGRTPAATLTALLAAASPVAADQDSADGLHLPGVTARVTLDYVTQYFFRGYEQLDSDQGVVLQPGAEVTIPVAEVGAVEIDATVGVWASIHTDSRGADPGGAFFFPGWGPANPTSFYERRIYGYFSFDTDLVTFDAGLTYYTFPSQALNIDRFELNLIATLNDERWLGDFAFNPYIELSTELQNNNPFTGRNAADELVYIELGGAFEFDMAEVYDVPIVWSVPFAIGLSPDQYYADLTYGNTFFGFASVGLFGSVPLSELLGTDQWLGAWELTAGVTVYFLNSDLSGLQTDNTSGSSDNYQFVATLGISREW